MLNDLTDGIWTTGSHTRIDTLLINAGKVLGTLSADQTLGTTIGRGSKIAHQAGAGGTSIHGTTNAVGSTG